MDHRQNKNRCCLQMHFLFWFIDKCGLRAGPVVLLAVIRISQVSLVVGEDRAEGALMGHMLDSH